MMVKTKMGREFFDQCLHYRSNIILMCHDFHFFACFPLFLTHSSDATQKIKAILSRRCTQKVIKLNITVMRVICKRKSLPDILRFLLRLNSKSSSRWDLIIYYIWISTNRRVIGIAVSFDDALIFSRVMPSDVCETFWMWIIKKEKRRNLNAVSFFRACAIFFALEFVFKFLCSIFDLKEIKNSDHKARGQDKMGTR
jgi:hypothetical protein